MHTRQLLSGAMPRGMEREVVGVLLPALLE